MKISRSNSKQSQSKNRIILFQTITTRAFSVFNNSISTSSVVPAAALRAKSQLKCLNIYLPTDICVVILKRYFVSAYLLLACSPQLPSYIYICCCCCCCPLQSTIELARFISCWFLKRYDLSIIVMIGQLTYGSLYSFCDAKFMAIHTVLND